MSGITLAQNETTLWRIVAAILAIARGASNSGDTVTLRANQTTTVVSSEIVGVGMRVFLEPTTANAAAVVASTYVSSVGQKTFTITHPSNANVDKTFFWEAKG